MPGKLASFPRHVTIPRACFALILAYMTLANFGWRPRSYLLEWLAIFLIIFLFSRATLLDFDAHQLQQNGEHNESATLPILAEIALRRGEIPLWNPYMLTGFPHAGDPVNHFWNPVATLPVILWGGVNGMKVSVFLSLLVAAYGQWFLAHTFGLRGIFRLWAGLLFALSGGLLLFWRVGWYELLLGAVWFPWCFALLWRALRRRDRSSIALAALAVAMVLTTGGGYYPFYLGVSLVVLAVAFLITHRAGQRRRLLGRAVAIAALGLALSAVYLLPLADGLRFTQRDAPPDKLQLNSQPIPYALFNYVVSAEEWFTTPILNKSSGYGWFYIGFLPLLAAAFSPWLFGRFRWRRRALLALLLVLVVLLLWQANRHPPVSYLYDWLPFLATLRFPNRLLTIATIPLVIVAAMNLQGLLVMARRPGRGHSFGAGGDDAPRGRSIPVNQLINLAAVVCLMVAMVDVYRVNQSFAMHPNPRLLKARALLDWLREADGSVYYINVGITQPDWSWTAYAYEYEMPVFNFRYNRHVRSMDAQYAAGSPFKAQPKYILAPVDQAPLPGSTLVTTIDGIHVWYQPDALPYAFAAARPDGPINRHTVVEQAVRLDGPNRVVITGRADTAGGRLVVLISDYPGWRLRVDGQPATLEPTNGYLGAALLPGEHTYVFEFRPPLHYIGVGISLMALLGCLWLLGAGRLRGAVARRR